MNEIKHYTLTCEKCEEAYYSKEGFPHPQLCPECLMRDEIAGLELGFTEGSYDIYAIRDGHTHLQPTGIDKLLSLETKTHRIAVIPQTKIICLCGSTKFKDAFTKAQLDETLAGKIVLTIGCNMKSDTEIFGHLDKQEFDAIKLRLDDLHKRKIDLADEVMILNVGGYIGESTRSELNYALKLGKPIKYLEEAQL